MLCVRGSRIGAIKGPHYCGGLTMFDWDDLRHFLAVAREGSTIAAARALGVNQSTVQRRLVALEREFGQPLVSRTPTGYSLTSFGSSLLPSAQAVEASVAQLGSHAMRAAHDVDARLRVTCPEPIMARLMPLIERFQATHPHLAVELVTSDRYLDLSKGDADVAFRSGDTDADLVGRKIADSIWAVYASEAYLDREGRPATLTDLARHSLITFDQSLAKHRLVSWLQDVAPDAHVAARVSSVLGLLQAARSGAGIAALPANIADADPQLIQIFGPVPELTRSWKILTTKTLRRTARVSELFDFIAAEREAVRAILN
jgi:DNA-binding transcriptional LysR family regulator